MMLCESFSTSLATKETSGVVLFAEGCSKSLFSHQGQSLANFALIKNPDAGRPSLPSAKLWAKLMVKIIAKPSE